MKLIQVVTRLNIGGPAIHVTLLNVGLQKSGFRPLLLFGRCEGTEGDMSYLLGPEAHAILVPSLSRSVRPWNNMRALWRIFRILRAERPDILHTHTSMAGCLGRVAGILAGIPVIVHTFHGNSLKGYFSPFVSAVFLQIERALARFTDAICVLSPQQLTELRDNFHIKPKSKFKLVPLGLDLSQFTQLPLPRAAGDRLRVGWIGRLVPVKNVPLLLSVIEATLRESSSVEFHVAGDGEHGHLLREAAQRFGNRLIWHGWVKDVAPVINECDLLIQTSVNEGTPVTLIQGMAAARPFVSTPVGGVIDMVREPELRNDGGAAWFSNGILVQSDAASFARVLLELSQNRSKLAEMGQDGRDFASDRYRAQTLLSAIESLYLELVHLKIPKADPRAAALGIEEGLLK